MLPPSSRPAHDAARLVVATDWSNATVPMATLRAYARCRPGPVSSTLVFALPHEPSSVDVECVKVLLEDAPGAAGKDIALESFAEAAQKSFHVAVVPQGDRDVVLLEIAELVSRMHTLEHGEEGGNTESPDALKRRFDVYSEAGASPTASAPPPASATTCAATGASWYGTYVGGGRILAALRTGGRAYLPADNRATTPNVLQTGVFEPELHAYIRAHVPYGGRVVDVGANIGLLTIALGRAVGPLGRVIAFEPVPINLEFVRWNVETNWLMDTVDIVAMAASATNGTAPMSISREWNSLGSLTQKRIDITPGHVAGGQQTIDVDTVRLDRHIPDDVSLNLVKIDVEGAEHLVFEGMSGLFARNAVERVAFECMREHMGDAWVRFMSTLRGFEADGWSFGVPRLDGDVTPLPVAALDASGSFRCVVMEQPGLRAPVTAHRI